MVRPTTYRLTARCRQCAAPVRLRNSERGISLLRAALEMGFDREDVIQTYQCARILPDGHLCNTLVEIRLGDWVPYDLG